MISKYPVGILKLFDLIPVWLNQCALFRGSPQSTSFDWKDWEYVNGSGVVKDQGQAISWQTERKYRSVTKDFPVFEGSGFGTRVAEGMTSGFMSAGLLSSNLAFYG